MGTMVVLLQKVLPVFLVLVFMILPFLLGYPLRRLIKEPFSRYTPFMVAVYEGGMVAYPLYASLCGSENLWQIAPLPCGHCVARGAAGHDDPGDAPYGTSFHRQLP